MRALIKGSRQSLFLSENGPISSFLSHLNIRRGFTNVFFCNSYENLVMDQKTKWMIWAYGSSQNILASKHPGAPPPDDWPHHHWATSSSIIMFLLFFLLPSGCSREIGLLPLQFTSVLMRNATFLMNLWGKEGPMGWICWDIFRSADEWVFRPPKLF